MLWKYDAGFFRHMDVFEGCEARSWAEVVLHDIMKVYL